MTGSEMSVYSSHSTLNMFVFCTTSNQNSRTFFVGVFLVWTMDVPTFPKSGCEGYIRAVCPHDVRHDSAVRNGNKWPVYGFVCIRAEGSTVEKPTGRMELALTASVWKRGLEADGRHVARGKERLASICIWIYSSHRHLKTRISVALFVQSVLSGTEGRECVVEVQGSGEGGVRLKWVAEAEACSKGRWAIIFGQASCQTRGSGGVSKLSLRSVLWDTLLPWSWELWHRA